MKGSNLVGNITRVTAWLALVIEVFDFVEKGLGLNLTQVHHDDLEKLGIFLFLVSLITWLETSNRSLSKLDQLSSQLEALVNEAKRIDLVAKYGTGGVWLARLLHPQEGEAARFPHCRAGGETLSQLLLNTYTQAAKEFHRLMSGDGEEVKLREDSVINLFLANLVKSLPPHSVWLGISRLQDTGAWERGTAEPSYYEFERAVESRVRGSSLTCLRVLCFQTEERYKSMSHIAERQMETGLHLRCFIKENMPDDLSLIWIPRSDIAPKLDLEDPVGFLENMASNFEPLCGISFEIRGDREVYTMALVGPQSNDFVQLKIHFRHSWEASASYQVADAGVGGTGSWRAKAQLRPTQRLST